VAIAPSDGWGRALPRRPDLRHNRLVSLVELAVSLVVAVVATLGGAWGLLSWFQHRNESYVDKTEARLTASSTQLKHEVTTAITDLRADLDIHSNEHRADTTGLRNELKSSLAEVRTDLRADLDTRANEHRADTTGLRNELKSSLAELKTDLTRSVDTLRSDVRALTSRLDAVISQQAESARGLYSMGERLQAELSHSLQEIRREQRQADERLETLWAERQARR